MKSIMCNSFVVMLFVCLSVKYASSIECYECESHDPDSACRNALNPSMIKLCPVEKRWCFSAHGNRYGDFYIIRQCMNYNDIEDKIDEDDPRWRGVHVYGTVCNEDLCNGAVDILPREIMLFISVMLSASFYKFVY